MKLSRISSSSCIAPFTAHPTEFWTAWRRPRKLSQNKQADGFNVWSAGWPGWCDGSNSIILPLKLPCQAVDLELGNQMMNPKRVPG